MSVSVVKCCINQKLKKHEHHIQTLHLTTVRCPSYKCLNFNDLLGHNTIVKCLQYIYVCVYTCAQFFLAPFPSEKAFSCCSATTSATTSAAKSATTGHIYYPKGRSWGGAYIYICVVGFFWCSQCGNIIYAISTRAGCRFTCLVGVRILISGV